MTTSLLRERVQATNDNTRAHDDNSALEEIAAIEAELARSVGRSGEGRRVGDLENDLDGTRAYIISPVPTSDYECLPVTTEYYRLGSAKKYYPSR